MTDYRDDFNRYADALREQEAALDRDDYYHAIADVDVGRHRKHIPETDIDPLTGKKRDKVAQAMQRTLEWMLANDPIYRQAHESLMASLREVQIEADNLFSDLHDQLEAARDHLALVLSNAARLPDGRAVFKYADGIVRDEDGNAIDAELAAGIEWHDDMPSGEVYEAAKERVQNIEDALHDVHGIQNELGDIHNRATNDEKPLASTDDVEAEAEKVDGLRERLKQIETGLSNTQHQAYTAENAIDEASVAIAKTADVSLPKIGS